jgi:hypothetical protein
MFTHDNTDYVYTAAELAALNEALRMIDRVEGTE